MTSNGCFKGRGSGCPGSQWRPCRRQWRVRRTRWRPSPSSRPTSTGRSASSSPPSQAARPTATAGSRSTAAGRRRRRRAWTRWRRPWRSSTTTPSIRTLFPGIQPLPFRLIFWSWSPWYQCEWSPKGLLKLALYSGAAIKCLWPDWLWREQRQGSKVCASHIRIWGYQNIIISEYENTRISGYQNISNGLLGGDENWVLSRSEKIWAGMFGWRTTRQWTVWRTSSQSTGVFYGTILRILILRRLVLTCYHTLNPQ